MKNGVPSELWVYTVEEMWDTEKKLMSRGYIKKSDAPLIYRNGDHETIIILK